MNSNAPIKVLVGRNGEGKSYHLNSILSSLPNTSVYISEEGIVRILYQKNRVLIDKEKKLYIYTDDKARGDRASSEQQEIEDKAWKVVTFCNKVITSLLGITNKSQGQKKLQHIMEIFLNYNLNNIDYVLFDEPENFLDEEYLKVISQLISLLTSNAYKVRIATHSSRLLSLLNINIDDIILLSNRNEYKISTGEIKDIFKEVSKLVEAERTEKHYNEDASIKYKLSIPDYDIVFTNFIESNLKSIDFYSCLFYEEIIIVEGISDLEALNSIKYSFDNSVIFYSANGKAWIPLYANIFIKLDKEVTVIIDVDPTKQNHSTAITTVLDNMKELRVVKHDPDMEVFYEIDTSSIGNILGMSNGVRRSNRGWLKQIAAYSHFKTDTNRENLRRHIFDQDMDIYKFE